MIVLKIGLLMTPHNGGALIPEPPRFNELLPFLRQANSYIPLSTRGRSIGANTANNFHIPTGYEPSYLDQSVS